MTIVFLLIPLGLVLMTAAVAALFWAVNSGQYDDIESAGHSVLEPDDPACVDDSQRRPNPDHSAAPK